MNTLYEPMTWRGRVVLAIGLAVVAAAMVLLFQWWTNRWHDAPITSIPGGAAPVLVDGADGRLLRVRTGRCRAELRVTVEETAEQVRVRVEERHGSEDDCGNAVMVGLFSPLGDREVVDQPTGSVVLAPRR